MSTHQSRSQRRRQSARSQQQRRPGRVVVPQAEPVDYSLDYAYVRYDLKRIALWGILLFAGMFAMTFFI